MAVRASADRFALLLLFLETRKQIAISAEASRTAVPAPVKRSRWDIESPRPAAPADTAQNGFATTARVSLSVPTPPTPSSSASAPPFYSTVQPLSPESKKKEEPLPPNWYKTKGTKDYKVVYDPLTDSGPVKKGKDLIYRYDGEGITERVVDPRLNKSSHKSSKSRTLLVDSVALLTYAVSR